MDDVRIENWEIVTTQSDPYKAPEQWPCRLQGNVYGHPAFKEGDWVQTSQIMETNGNRVKTYTRWYVLGEPNEKYVLWCKDHAPQADLNKPFPEKP